MENPWEVLVLIVAIPATGSYTAPSAAFDKFLVVWMVNPLNPDLLTSKIPVFGLYETESGVIFAPPVILIALVNVLDEAI